MARTVQVRAIGLWSSTMKEFSDSELLRLISRQLDGPGLMEKELGRYALEIIGSQLVLRYEGTGTRRGRFKTVIDIPEFIGDDIWNDYCDGSSDIAYWIIWAVIVPVNEAYCTSDLFTPMDSDGSINLPLVR
ncbi:hypothetical protein [Glutamicibacter sp.]|uniref:hypothetical protein n=1 Tax=Glutamicibacter sp. TaxID=1931995 RepID=UPI0028BEA7EC|nr:hypothetical protein [Glutamicibacter sp.]